MSISKTRQKLVDVARQLFAKNGIANTTMNDIAVASGKGRRTLYTYFNRKEDVYSAVIGQARRGGRHEDAPAGQDYRADLHPSEHDTGDGGAQRQPACRVLPQHLDGGEGAQEV